MQQSFTKDFMKRNCGCYNKGNLLDRCSFMQVEREVTLESIVYSEIPIKDKFWFVCKKVLSKDQNQRLAISLAELVLPIFEKRYPEDLRPREAIEASKQYLAGHISLEQLLLKRRAAYDAA